MKPEITVSIFCETYNQEAYIAQCLEGMLMQQTDFEFEILVCDDASTDHTADIVRTYEQKYPHRMKVLYQQENQYSKRISIWKNYQLPRAKGKYIAFCEGDDYWTDRHKLQKQVDYLETHPECGIIYTHAAFYFQKSGKIGKDAFGEPFSTYDELLCCNRIPTLTACIRKENLHQYYQEVQPEKYRWRMGDYPLWLWIARHTKVKFMEEVTAVYRVLAESASHTLNPDKREAFILSDLDIKRFYTERYPSSLSDEFFRQKNNLLYLLCDLCLKTQQLKKSRNYARQIEQKWLTPKQLRKIKRFWPRYLLYMVKACLGHRVRNW